MRTVIQQIKERVSKMYETVVDYFMDEKLEAKVYDTSDVEIFTLRRDNIDTFEPEKGVVAIFIDISSDLLKEFCDKHMDEPPHFISRVDFWVNSEERVYLHSVKLKEQVGIINDSRNISIRYNFTYNYVEDQKDG